MLTEAIDTTQWLPRNSPIINPYRAAKGDIDGHLIDGRIASVRVVDKNIANTLLHKGFIEDYHMAYGLALMDIIRISRGASLIKANSIYGDVFGGELSDNMAGKLMYMLRKKIGSNNIKILERAFNETEDADCNTIAGLNAYRNCFELLVKSMDDAREELAQEKACKPN